MGARPRGGGGAARRHLLASHGMVTGEFAVAMLALVPIMSAMLLLIVMGAEQVRVLESARTAARMLARGDSEAQARAQVTGVIPSAQVSSRRQGRDVVVRVVHPVDPLGPLPAFTIGATAVTPVEEPDA